MSPKYLAGDSDFTVKDVKDFPFPRIIARCPSMQSCADIISLDCEKEVCDRRRGNPEGNATVAALTHASIRYGKLGQRD